MQALSRRYATIRAHTEALAAPLTPEDQCVQSMPDASPVKMASSARNLVFRGIRPACRARELSGVSTRIFVFCSIPIMKRLARGILGPFAVC